MPALDRSVRACAGWFSRLAGARIIDGTVAVAPDGGCRRALAHYFICTEPDTVTETSAFPPSTGTSAWEGAGAASALILIERGSNPAPLYPIFTFRIV